MLPHHRHQLPPPSLRHLVSRRLLCDVFAPRPCLSFGHCPRILPAATLRASAYQPHNTLCFASTMAYYGGQQPYNSYAPNNRGQPPIPPPYPAASAHPQSPYSPASAQAPYGSHSPYPQTQLGYNRPPPPPPPGQPQSPYPAQQNQQYQQQPYGQPQQGYVQQQPYGQPQAYGQYQYGQQPPPGNPYVRILLHASCLRRNPQSHTRGGFLHDTGLA